MSLLDAILSLPTVLFTIPLGIACVYWGFVLAGALDVDLLDGSGGLEGAGDLEGGAKAGGELLAGAKGAGQALSGEAAQAAAGDVGFDLLAALKLREVPLTVSLSLLLFWAWLLSLGAMTGVAPQLEGIAPPVLVALLFGVASALLALPITSACVRPLVPLFRTHEASSHATLVGRECTIITLQAHESFGQARVHHQGADLLLKVRTAPGVQMQRGQPGILVDYDPSSDRFTVEPTDRLLLPGGSGPAPS